MDSWNILWDEDYSGQIIMADSVRDSFMVALKILGYSLNTTDEKELKEAEVPYKVPEQGIMIETPAAVMILIWWMKPRMK